MLYSTIILGWIGIVIFLIIVISFQKMARSNEFALLHLLMAFMYAMWFPLPILLYQLLNTEVLLAGTLFGIAYLFSLVFSMLLQTGHIAFVVKNNEDHSISNKMGDYMMATLTDPLESFLNIFKCMWALFLGIAFWQNGEILMTGIMFAFTLFIFYYIFIMLDATLTKRLKLLSKVRPNSIVVNLETLLFFITLMCYVTFHS